MTSAQTFSPAVAEFFAAPHRMFIDGQFRDSRLGQEMDLIDPSTGQVFARAQLGGAADVDAAVAAARNAFDNGPWPRLPSPERRRLLLALADAIEAEIPAFAEIDSVNMGIPMSSAKFIIGELSVESLRYNAGWMGKIGGEVINTATPDTHVYTVKDPIGVIGAIVPWNSPLMAAMVKLAPALAAGCTVVLKPAELTPLSVLKLAELVQRVGIPAGVLNIVNGVGSVAGQALVEHPGVDKIAFTGSTAVGQGILRSVAATMKRVTLELGGKSPVFILPDADLDRAIDAAAAAIFRNAGQICAAGSRVFAHRKVFDKVVAGLAERAGAMAMGRSLDAATQLGPVVSQRQRERVLGYVEIGRGEGAEVVCGGQAAGDAGFFVQPTVLASVKPDMRVVREEIFGPVVGVQMFEDDDLDRLAALGNDSEYGLAAYIWTTNVSTAHKLARRVKSGIVLVNGGPALDRGVPFGGFKMSGWGREYGREGFEGYLETKSVSIAL
ncbi:MAG: aldehyde dehydrogenase family protein [Novosphingobium sp.]|nr:aldehyde dehydrogenase family protein [Novosphingobium sp.]